MLQVVTASKKLRQDPNILRIWESFVEFCKFAIKNSKKNAPFCGPSGDREINRVFGAQGKPPCIFGNFFWGYKLYLRL